MPCHWHPNYWIVHILSGSLQLIINNDNQIYRENDIIFIIEGFLHGGVPRDCEYECVVFDMKFLLLEHHACMKATHDIMGHRIMIHQLFSARSKKNPGIVSGLCEALSFRITGYEFMTQGIIIS